MNENDIITLAPNVTIKYIDNILVGGKNYYKYEAKVNDNQKNLYLNKKICNDSKQKNDVYKFILNNENNDSTDIFLDLDIKNDVNSADFGGIGGDIPVQKSRNQNPKLSENWRDYIDNALISIRNTSNCSIGVIENFFNKESSISGKYKYIDDNMAESKNLYNKMLNSGKGGSGDLSGMVTNYRNTFNDIAYGILEMFEAAQTKAINSDELKMMDDKSKEYFGTESFNNEFKDILSNSKLELKKTNNNFLFKDMFKEIGALQAKYSVASLSENESIFKSISNSIDGNIDEEMKDKVDELVKFMAGFLEISELEARKAIKENPIEMANQLYDAQMSIAENVKNGGSGYDAPEISTSFWEFKDAFYSTDAGKEALFNRFLNSDSDAEGEFPKNITPYDEKNSIAYTNYITYCMQIGKLNWLMDSCKEFPVVIDKINNNDVFTVPEEVTDTNTLSYIAKNIEDYNVAPFGYVKKGDKWYQVNYNKRGQDMLYYMDYHCGENSSNSGDDRVITAFSNQGRVDSVERNYKGLWIDSHLNGDYDKNSSEYKSAERDYYVLNGVIEDKKRYNELTESGELSFKDLVNYSGLSDSEKDKLTDINYINEHKDEIKETMDLSEKQLYNFSVLFSTEGINTGDPTLDARLAASRIALSTMGSAVTQFGGGLFKFFENVGDAANTAIHSDFVLGSVEYDYTDWDGTSEPDAKFDLTKEFKEFRDSTWKDFYESEKYNKEFSSFKDSVVGLRQLESKLYNDYYQFDGNTDGYYYVNGKIYKSVDEIPNYVKENAFADLFKQNKLKEWDLKDTSSSNYYLAAFKEGIREGGDFTRFDNLSDKVVENAKIQFKAQEEVEVDKTGEWMESNIYNTDFYKNMEDYSFVKKDNILGMMFNQVGNMAVPIAISMFPGMFGASASALGTTVASSAQVFQGLSSAALFTSAFGGATEEAFINGASYNEALKYATLSATTELAIEHVFSGIGGYGEGWLDDALEYLPNKFFASKGLDTNLTAQTLKTLITGGLGEAVEEVTTDFVTPLWQSMTYMNDKTYYDVLNENVSLGSLAQTALVSFLSSMIFKGVEINQQTSAFNKNFTNLQNRISSVSNLNLDSNVLETQAKKVLAQYVGGIIENEGVIKSGLLEQLIKNASNQLVSDPKSREQLSKLQDELVSFKNQEVTIGEGKDSINVTGSELLKLEDYSGFDGKYTIEDGKIKFEDEKTQSRFNSSILDLAQKQTDSYNSSLKELVMEFQNSKGSVNANNKVNNLQDAISTIIEYDNNKFDTNDLVFFEYKGETLLIPKSIATATTTKLSIEEGKISFKKDMNSDKFIGKLYDKTIGLCNEQIRKNTYDINKATNKGLVNKAIDIIRPSLVNSIPLTFITGITQTENDNLTKIDVEATINGIVKNISVYVENDTNPSIYKEKTKLNDLIREVAVLNRDTSNIYLGKLIIDNETGEIRPILNTSNLLYVQSLEFENAKENANSQALRSAIGKVKQSRTDLTNSTNVTIKYKGDSILIPEILLKEITSKYKLIDGVVKFNQDMNIDKFALELYNKAINLNNNAIVGINNTTIKNSSYVNVDNMDLYKLEVETIIDGETRTINVYVDGNTDIASIKDSSKISEKLYQLITQNKNSENIYAGNIKYNEKTGSINATYNEANKLYVDGLNKTSESNSSIDAVVNDETAKSEKMDSDNAKSGDIKKGESYEYSVEEINEDDSTIKPKETVEAKEKPANTGSESVITNVAQTASVAATAGATSQAIYQNNGETSSAKDTSKAKNISPKSNTQVKENAHVETNNNSIINISKIKSQIKSYIDSIKTECEKYIEMHQNDENFEHRFEQFKRDKIMELNDKLSEVRKTIIDSNNAELNAINEKINSLSENDSLRDELISERDKLIEKQQQELSNIATSANEKLQKVFSELVVNNNTNATSQVANNEVFDVPSPKSNITSSVITDEDLKFIDEGIATKDAKLPRTNRKLSQSLGVSNEFKKLSQNEQLYEYLTHKYSKTYYRFENMFGSLFPYRKLDLKSIVDLKIDGIQDLSGIEELPGLESIKVVGVNDLSVLEKCSKLQRIEIDLPNGPTDVDLLLRLSKKDGIKSCTFYGRGVKFITSEQAMQFGNTAKISYDEIARFTPEQFSKIQKRLSEVESLITPEMTDIQKVETIYKNLLQQNFEYDYNIFSTESNGYLVNNTMYGPLVENRGVCVGIASALETALKNAGLEAVSCGGWLNTQPTAGDSHQWNQVKVDGEWYNLDLTNDYDRKSWKYFMKSDTDYDWAECHCANKGDKYEPIHDCTSTKYDETYRQNSNVDGTISNIINIDGVEITVESLKELQTPSNLENALKTGEYRGVRIEKALVELSKIDGVNLDSKLQELVKISENLGENEVIFNIENVYYQNAEPLILTKEFVSTLTVEQRDFLTQVSSEQGLIEYLQNNPLIKVDLLERSELANTDNKYLNKLIQLISENQGTTKQIYNVMDVVKNNSTPILVDSTYKGDTHTLSTNEVLDFMKTGKVDTKYSYSDYVKATNTLMNDIASQNASIDINGDVFNGISMYNEISGYLDGSSNFTALYNLNIIEKCNKFYEFISKNNISLDSAVMEKLDFISKLEENKTIANLNDYFNGKSPIVMDKYIRVYGREISTQSLIDLVEMKSPNYLILLRDYKISSIPNSERFIITSAIDKLMSSNTDLAEYYKSNYEKFNSLYQNKYVLKNSFILVPSTIGEYPTKYIDYILDNPYKISIYDGEERHQIISTVNAFAKYLDENNLSSYYSSSKLDFLNRKVVDIDSSVSYTTELSKMFDTNGESFGANQGAVRELIIRLKMNDAVQSIFGNKIETKDFMETLNNMNFTEEQFKNALLTVNANNLLPLGDIEMLNTLIEQVVDNYPGMSKKDALQFLYLLESEEAGGRGICNYASMVNLIFDKYKNNIDLFEKHFGYPMYLTINGKEQLNTTRLLVDMYSTINEGLLVAKENGTYKVATSSKVYRNLTRNFYGDISKENFERFLTKKGIKFNINEKFTYSTVDPDNMFHYEEIITNVRESLAKGEHVHLTSMNFSLYNLDGSIFNYDIEPHIMSVVGINEDGKLLVDSWGKKLLFDLREELARLTNDDLSLDALKIKHYTTIVSYDISLDNNSNHSTSLDIKTDVNKERNTYNGSYTEVFDEHSSSIKSNVTSSVITKEDLEFIDEGFETRDAEAPMTSAQSVQSDVHSDVSNIINIDGVDITVETLKELQTQSNLETALKTGEYAGVRVEKTLVELSKLDGVTLDSKLQELVKISENLKENEIIFNIEDVYSNDGTANIINIDVYNEFMKTNLNSSISLDNLYKIINSNGDIYKLISNDTIIKNVSNESIKESFEYLVSISNRYNYENKVIRETQYLLNLLEDNYTTEELYDAFAIAHTEFNTPDVYYECYDYLKTMDVDSAVKLLESKGYTTLDITDAFLNLAIRMDSQELSKKYYYKAFDYLVENGMDEKEAATIITDKYRTLIYRRGTRVVATTPNGVKIKIVNNISTNNKLFAIEKIESMIKQAEKYYSKTGLKEIVIFDSFAPHNIYSEKVQYEDYVKTHNNKRFIAAASATNSSILLWEDFDKLDSIVHEYGHTIDKHIKLVNKLATDFSTSSTWLEAIQKDTEITSKRVSEYAYASNGEDFAEFLKHFNRNPLEVARKYPNRYKAASKYLNLDIDSNIIDRYLDSKQFFIDGIEYLSTLLTDNGTMLEFIKQYAFENLKGNNSIAKTVISKLDAIYESKLEIIEDYGLYSLFMDMREQERIGSNEFIKIMKDYLDGKDISSKIKDSRNLEIIELLEKEEIQEWYEEELNEMTAETEKISVSDEEFEKLLNSISNDSESNSSSDTNVIEKSETMDFPIQDIPTTQDLEPYKVVQKYDHDDLIISEELVEKFSQRTIDAFISIYEYIPNLGQYIGKMDISGKTKLLDIITSLNVDVDSNSSLKQLKNLIEQLDGRHVFNLDDLSNDSKLVMLPKELYTQYGEQIDYLHKICSREYSLKSFLENPDLKILKELKDGLFKDVNFDPNTYYLIQRLYDASNVLLEDKVIVNTKNFVSKKGTELIVVDKETFELYKEELKQFDYITEDVYNLKNFILNSSDVEILKLKNLFDKVNIETTDEFISKVKNIIYELSNGKTIVNISEFNWIKNPIIMSKDIYNLNKEIVDNVVKNVRWDFDLIKYLESVDINTAIKLKQLIDNGDLVINTKNGEILNKLINDIASGNKIVNLNDVVYRDAKPLIINGEVYNTYVNQKPSLCITIDVIYDIFNSKDLIYRLLSNKTILSNVSNENVINSLKLYLEIANNKGYSDSVINEIKYYLDVMSDTPQFISKIFNGCNVRVLEMLINNPTKINSYTAFEKEGILKAINEYSEFIRNNYPKRYLNYVDNINVLTRNVPKIDSSISIETELYKMFENIGKIFGADQGAVRELLTRLKMNDVVQFLCGNKIKENNFMDTLNNMHFTEEQFKNALLEVNKESKSFLADKNTFDSLKKQVMKNYPGMIEKDATQFLYLMEAYKDSEGICNYAAAVNLIFNKYKNNPRLFEEHFGYPMYVTIDGKNELNTTMLLVDMYSIINDGGLVTNENGIYKVNTSNENYLNLSDNGKLNMEYFQKFLDRKGIKFNKEETYVYQSEPRTIPNSTDMMHYEEVITNIHDCLARGEHVDISAYGFNLYKPDGTIIAKDVGGHIMTVVGITSDGNLIVDSWGRKLIFNLKEQMSNLGDVYEIEEKFGIERRRRVNIVSYDISFDNIINISTSSNIDANINNSTNTQTSGESINSPKSSVTSTIDTDLDIIDVSTDIRNVDSLMSRSDLSQKGYESDGNADIPFENEVVDVNDEVNKILKWESHLEKFIKSKDTSLARSISNLIKSGNVDLSSPIGIKLKQIVDAVADNGHLINLDAFVYGTESPIIVNNEVYIEYNKINPGKSIKELYDLVKKNSLYEKLSSKEKDTYMKSIDTLLGLSNDKNALINELEVISKALKEDSNNAFDIISRYHMEAKLPRGYSEYSDLLKSGLSINEAISQLESSGYKFKDISYIVMSAATMTYNDDIIQKSYYDLFEYLKVKFMEENLIYTKDEQKLIEHGEKRAAETIRDQYQELIDIRGTRIIDVTESGVVIRVVNNCSSSYALTKLEEIKAEIANLENMFGKSKLNDILIYDTFSPENLYNEKVEYKNYVETYKKRFIAAATATSTRINIWDSFKDIKTISHEYGHTIDFGVLGTDSKHFSKTEKWETAKKKDGNSISEYGNAKIEEDFAEFIKYYYKNPIEVALKYPNRYLAIKDNLKLKIDIDTVNKYIENKNCVLLFREISQVLGNDSLDIIKKFVMNSNIDTKNNIIVDSILKALNSKYTNRTDILKDMSTDSILNKISIINGFTDIQWIDILGKYLNGESIVGYLSEEDIKLIELLNIEEVKKTYNENLEIYNYSFLSNEESTDAISTSSNDGKSTYNDSLIKDADVDMAFPKKSIFSKKIETVSVSDIPRVFRNMNTTDIISILEGKTTLINDENFINNKKSIIRFVKYLSENNIKLSLNERASAIIENLRNGDFKLNILNFSGVLNGDAPIYGPLSITLDGIKISTDDVMAYLENKKNEISSIITSETPNEDARDLLNAIDELGNKNDIIYDKYRKSIKLIERIERSYVYKSYDSYYLLPKSFNGIDTSNILNSDMLSLVSYINSLSNADKKTYRVALDEFGEYIYKTNTRLSKQDLSRVNRLYDVINTKKFRTDAVIKSKIYDTFEMSYQNDGEFGSNQGKVREVIEKLGITDVIQNLFSERVERSKFLQTLSEFNISESDFINALNRKNQSIIMNSVFIDGDINFELFNSLIDQVKMNYPNMSTMDAVRFLYLIETKEAAGPGICNNPILVNMIFDSYVGKETIFERDFGYPMYIKANNGKKVLNEARLLVDIFSTLNDGVLVHNVNGKYMINTTSVNYVRAYDLNGLRIDAVEKFINKKGLNINVSKSYFFNSNEELMHYDYLMEQIKSELSKGNYVIFGGKGFDMDVENFEFREDCDAHGMTIVGIDTTGKLLLDTWGMKARIDLKKELSRLNTMFKDRNSNMTERIFTISSYNIN